MLLSTRVGALGVNAGTQRAAQGPEVRPHSGMNLAPLFECDARTLSWGHLRTRTRKGESNAPRC